MYVYIKSKSVYVSVYRYICMHLYTEVFTLTSSLYILMVFSLKAQLPESGNYMNLYLNFK